MLKRLFFTLSGLLVINICVLWAGDTASFVDLGFSPDGSRYMFAQYGVKFDTLAPWADMFIVDVARNNFVSGGRISYTHNQPIAAGHDGSGALYHLIAKNAGLAERNAIPYTNQGQPLYIAMDGDPAYEGKAIEFRDFIFGSSYRATLAETVSGSGRTARSSFHITLEKTDKGGRAQTFTIGTPQLQRPLVLSYRIKKVLTAPAGNALIFVVEMQIHSTDGNDIRYMVEALHF